MQRVMSVIYVYQKLVKTLFVYMGAQYLYLKTLGDRKPSIAYAKAAALIT